MSRPFAPPALAFLLLAAPAFAADDVPWSFKPVARPAPPAVRDAAWPRGPLDHFILSRVEAAGLTPNPDANRLTLVRRVAFDLTGLPPTPAEVDAFLADPSPDDAALARVVDAYLNSPRFGERWGRHWLDVARYADSVGRSWNAPFTYAWRYRDWVIDSFNADKPFDRFVREQIAGDLLPAKSVEQERDQRIGTGFLAVGSISIQEGSAEQLVLDRVDDQLDATTRGFLGLTVACARCHNHKTDPISARDYYALAGVFYSTRTRSGQGTRVGDEGSKDYVDGNLLVRLPRAGGPAPAVGGVHTMTDYTEVLRTGRRSGIRYAFDPDRAMGATDGEIRNCAVRAKGDPHRRGDVPPRGDVRIAGLPRMGKVPAGASGRKELADWVASPANPLTARVFVNRAWLHLFGRGLVATPDDFGFTGEKPTHPELLDYLASRFVADGWSVKKLVRSVVLSRTYRLSGAGNPAGREKDAANTLYWRADARRLEVEAIRDSLLSVAGRLSFDRPEGIPVSGTGGKGRGAVAHSLHGLDSSYRTVYLPVLRSLLPDLYTTFDFPDPSQISGRREVTTVAPQALFFLNGALATACARDAAGELMKGPHRTDAERVRAAYRRVLGRPATADEAADGLALLGDLGGGQAGLATLVQGLMATAEFRYVR